MLTRQKAQKDGILDDLGIDTIVNFWPKLDQNLESRWVLHMATNSSRAMLDEDIRLMAETVALLLEVGRTVLVLCEAGKTRSVYFSILVVSFYFDINYTEALKYVEERVPNHRLKNFMLEELHDG